MNKLIVITGATRGIGKAIAETFAKNQFDVVTCGRDLQNLEQFKEDIQALGVTAYACQADLSDKQQCLDFVSLIKDLERPIDVLVNNTGVFIPGQVHDEEEGALEKMIETNLYSAYRITRGLLPQMMEKKQGHVFNICSTASITPYINGGSYCISKYAMYGMTKVLREEMKEHNVRVTAILPGATKTDSWEGAEIPEERFMQPEEVAETIWTTYSLSERTVVEEIVMRPLLGDI